MGAMHRFSFYALVLFFFSLPWQDIVALPGGSTFSVARIVGLFLIAAAVAATLSRGSVRLRVPALSLILTGLFCAWVALSGVGSLWSPTGAFVKTTTYVQLAVMATIIWQLCRTEQQHVALRRVRAARVDDDELGARAQALLEARGEDRVAVGGVGADHQQEDAGTHG